MFYNMRGDLFHSLTRRSVTYEERHSRLNLKSLRDSNSDRRGSDMMRCCEGGGGGGKKVAVALFVDDDRLAKSVGRTGYHPKHLQRREVVHA